MPITGKTILNGVEIPKDFNVGIVMGPVAFSQDGTKYVTVSNDKQLVFGEVPSDGRIFVGGQEIHYQQQSNRGIYISGAHIDDACISTESISSVGGNNVIHIGRSVVINSSGIHIGNHEVNINSSKLEQEIDKSYAGVQAVNVDNKVGSIDLGLSPDANVYVQGNVRTQHEYISGELIIEEHFGKIKLPASDENLRIYAHTKVGSVSGDVAHAGTIDTKTGSIKINVCAPLEVRAKTSVGKVSVNGMMSNGHGTYTPTDKPAIGTLVLDTKVGSIEVTYKPHKS